MSLILKEEEIDALLDEMITGIDQNEESRKFLFGKKFSSTLLMLTGEPSQTYPSPLAAKTTPDNDVFVSTLNNGGCIIIPRRIGAIIADLMLGGDGKNENYTAGEDSDTACVNEFVNCWIISIGLSISKIISVSKTTLYKESECEGVIDINDEIKLRDQCYFLDEKITSFYPNSFNLIINFLNYNDRIFISLSNELFDYLKQDQFSYIKLEEDKNGGVNVIYDAEEVFKKKMFAMGTRDIVEGLTGEEIEEISIENILNPDNIKYPEEFFSVEVSQAGEMIIPKCFGIFVAHTMLGLDGKCEHLAVDDDMDCVKEFASNTLHYINEKISTKMKPSALNYFTKEGLEVFSKPVKNYKSENKLGFFINFKYNEKQSKIMFLFSESFYEKVFNAYDKKQIFFNFQPEDNEDKISIDGFLETTENKSQSIYVTELEDICNMTEEDIEDMLKTASNIELTAENLAEFGLEPESLTTDDLRKIKVTPSQFEESFFASVEDFTGSSNCNQEVDISDFLSNVQKMVELNKKIEKQLNCIIKQRG